MKMMKSPEDALYTGVEEISGAIERGQFRRAANASNSLTRLAHSLESAKDVFVGEVMNAVCGHVDYVLRSYRVSRADGEAMHASIMRHTADLVNAHKEQQKVCHILQQIRHATTSFVLDAEQHYLPQTNPPAERGGQSYALSAPEELFEVQKDVGYDVEPAYKPPEEAWFAVPNTTFPMLVNQPMQSTYHLAEIQELREDVAGLRKQMDWLVGAVREIKKSLETRSADESGPDNYDMTVEQVRELILENYKLGEAFYPGDIADKHGLDYDTVLEAIDILRKERRIKDET